MKKKIHKHDDRLIELVKYRPVIWDSTLAYRGLTRNIKEKEIAWREISKDLKITVSEAQKRFVNLREKYRHLILYRDRAFTTPERRAKWNEKMEKKSNWLYLHMGFMEKCFNSLRPKPEYKTKLEIMDKTTNEQFSVKELFSQDNGENEYVEEHEIELNPNTLPFYVQEHQNTNGKMHQPNMTYYASQSPVYTPTFPLPMQTVKHENSRSRTNLNPNNYMNSTSQSEQNIPSSSSSHFHNSIQSSSLARELQYPAATQNGGKYMTSIQNRTNRSFQNHSNLYNNGVMSTVHGCLTPESNSLAQSESTNNTSMTYYDHDMRDSPYQSEQLNSTISKTLTTNIPNNSTSCDRNGIRVVTTPLLNVVKQEKNSDEEYNEYVITECDVNNASRNTVITPPMQVDRNNANQSPFMKGISFDDKLNGFIMLLKYDLKIMKEKKASAALDELQETLFNIRRRNN